MGPVSPGRDRSSTHPGPLVTHHPSLVSHASRVTTAHRTVPVSGPHPPGVGAPRPSLQTTWIARYPLHGAPVSGAWEGGRRTTEVSFYVATPKEIAPLPLDTFAMAYVMDETCSEAQRETLQNALPGTATSDAPSQRCDRTGSVAGCSLCDTRGQWRNNYRQWYGQPGTRTRRGRAWRTSWKFLST